MSAGTQEQADCTSCRWISGGVLTGAGIYVANSGRTMKGYERRLMFGIGLAFGCIGLARLLDLPPFRKTGSALRGNEVE